MKGSILTIALVDLVGAAGLGGAALAGSVFGVGPGVACSSATTTGLFGLVAVASVCTFLILWAGLKVFVAMALVKGSELSRLLEMLVDEERRWNIPGWAPALAAS